MSTESDQVQGRLIDQSGIQFTHGDTGNTLTETPNRTYTYNTDNLMATATVGGVTWNYKYDADGWRVLTTTTGSTAYAVRGPNGKLLTDWTIADGTISARDYIYAGDRLTAFVKMTNAPSAGSMVATPIPAACSGVTFTDNPLVAGTTVVKAVHLTQLRDAIDAVRARYGLQAYSWSGGIAAGSTVIQASHINEMRTALDAAYVVADQPLTWHADPTLTAGLLIKAAHFTELRGAVCALP